MKKFTIIFIVIIIVGLGVYFLREKLFSQLPSDTNTTQEQNNNEATTTEATQIEQSEIVIGKSVENRDIIAYNYGGGSTRILFVGGIHGGYSWNTSLVAYELMDYLKVNPNIIPRNVKVTVIPILNPDGLNKVVGTSSRFVKVDVSPSQAVQISGRYNANKVDLNRNFDCDWQSVAKWRTTSVSGGSKAFSEPESSVFKSYIGTHRPEAVLVWYSAAGGIYASSCDNAILPQTTTIINTFAKASGYPSYQSFDFYETTGDMANWLSKINIPAISVLLSTHEDIEWDKNRKGIEALLDLYNK